MIAFMWGMAVGGVFVFLAASGSMKEDNEKSWSVGAFIMIIILLALAIGFSVAQSSSNGVWQLVPSTPTPLSGR